MVGWNFIGVPISFVIGMCLLTLAPLWAPRVFLPPPISAPVERRGLHQFRTGDLVHLIVYLGIANGCASAFGRQEFFAPIELLSLSLACSSLAVLSWVAAVQEINRRRIEGFASRTKLLLLVCPAIVVLPFALFGSSIALIAMIADTFEEAAKQGVVDLPAVFVDAVPLALGTAFSSLGLWLARRHCAKLELQEHKIHQTTIFPEDRGQLDA